MLQLLLLLLIDVVTLATCAKDSVQVTSYRKSRKIRNGPGWCALDLANKTISSSSLKQCSLDCAHDVACAAFNLQNSDTTCDLYNYRPKVFAPVSTCENYQVILISLLSHTPI